MSFICRKVVAGALLGGLLLAMPPGCGMFPKADQQGPAGPPRATPGMPGQKGSQAGSAGQGATVPLGPRGDLPSERRALLMMNGEERVVDAAEAQAAGYTLVDLSDSWTPYIFRTLKDDQGVERENRYRRIFVGLADDQVDDDGQPLEPGEKNYLELFGIPPALSVVAARFTEDAARTCEGEIDFALLSAAKPVRYFPEKRQRQIDVSFERLQERAGAAGAGDKAAELERWSADRATLREAERRLACEGLIDKRARHRPGVYDDGLRDILKRFQQKHMIYEAPYLQRKTLAVLARRQVENDYETLHRVMSERVASAAAILEDGTADGKSGAPIFKSKTGQMLPVKNLIGEYTDAVLQQLGLTDPAKAQVFFSRHPAADFQWLRAAVKLPERPEYYADSMDLSIAVDRGDVWYELPFDEKGKSLSQSRQSYPSFILSVHHLGQKIPLVRWRTTVGGWRSEQAADGYEYYRYKGSDVGPRVVRNISSGPVWIAPETTPIRTLVKEKRVNGTYQTVVNYDEIGPGFRSAYGLVAGYFVVPGENGKPDFDNGIRAHGSADYLSIGSSEGFSHGCHRLLNHNAVRLYSFILTHRKNHVLGDQPLGNERRFLYKETVYELRIPSRGFAFQLDPPMPVTVLQGRIRGERKLPFTEYMAKPGVVYPGPPPVVGKGAEDRSGGGGGKSREDGADKETP